MRVAGSVRVADVLEVPHYSSLYLLSATHFTAIFEWDALPCTELVRSVEFISGGAWHDHVLYQLPGDAQLQYGHVRLIIAADNH